MSLNTTNPFEAKRLLDWQEAQVYTGLGRTRCREFCEAIGAVKKIGKRVLFDRKVIDEYLNDSENNIFIYE